jgi:long-chain acyl-CoA synthetase
MKVTRLFDLVDRYKEKYSNKTDAFAYKHNGSWIKESAQTFFENVDKVSVGLLSIGFEPGQKIATLSNNRPEWNYLDLGMMQVGGIHVPIYPTIAEADLKFIFQDAEVKYVFVSNLELWDKVQNAIKDLSGIKAVYTFDKLENKPHWTDILNVPNPESYHQRITDIKATIKNNDLATLLYTSGTTGVPKGVMLSHNNIISQLLPYNL